MMIADTKIFKRKRQAKTREKTKRITKLSMEHYVHNPYFRHEATTVDSSSSIQLCSKTNVPIRVSRLRYLGGVRWMSGTWKSRGKRMVRHRSKYNVERFQTFIKGFIAIFYISYTCCIYLRPVFSGRNNLRLEWFPKKSSFKFNCTRVLKGNKRCFYLYQNAIQYFTV